MLKVRTFTVALLIALSLSAAAAASPETEYRVVRILPNGNEVLLSSWEIGSQEDDNQPIRDLALSASRQNRTNNPAWRIVVYCPANTPAYTADDICWDSQTDL